MGLIKPGVWHNTVWASGTWQEDLWLEYGAPVTGGDSVWYYYRRKKKSETVFLGYLAELLKKIRE